MSGARSASEKARARGVWEGLLGPGAEVGVSTEAGVGAELCGG